ncbi:hypothetical protein C1645_744601 [Glomus cerebriforme]|uniref:CCHC-type domain-containing protein n=1 Tax=Glomus cerebriforme TaxID=658196 RepID=A0A397S758_9GLOM|nr:hypothetical protein C1645_744601 [Glomus cerebriforme]
MATKRSKREQETSATSLTRSDSENEKRLNEKTTATYRTLRSHKSHPNAISKGQGQNHTIKASKMRKTETSEGNTMDTDFNFRPELPKHLLTNLKDNLPETSITEKGETLSNADHPVIQQSTPIENDPNGSSMKIPITEVLQSDYPHKSDDQMEILIPETQDKEQYVLQQDDDDPCNLSQKRWYIATPVADSGFNESTNKEIVNIVNEFFIQHFGKYFIKTIVTRPGEELDETPRIVVYLTKKELAEELCNTTLEDFNNAKFILRPYPKGKKPGSNRRQSREEEYHQSRDPELQILVKNIPLNTTPYEIKMVFHEDEKALVDDVFMLTPDKKGFLRARVQFKEKSSVGLWQDTWFTTLKGNAIMVYPATFTKEQVDNRYRYAATITGFNRLIKAIDFIDMMTDIQAKAIYIPRRADKTYNQLPYATLYFATQELKDAAEERTISFNNKDLNWHTWSEGIKLCNKCGATTHLERNCSTHHSRAQIAKIQKAKGLLSPDARWSGIYHQKKIPGYESKVFARRSYADVSRIREDVEENEEDFENRNLTNDEIDEMYGKNLSPPKKKFKNSNGEPSQQPQMQNPYNSQTKEMNSILGTLTLINSKLDVISKDITQMKQQIKEIKQRNSKDIQEIRNALKKIDPSYDYSNPNDWTRKDKAFKPRDTSDSITEKIRNQSKEQQKEKEQAENETASISKDDLANMDRFKLIEKLRAATKVIKVRDIEVENMRTHAITIAKKSEEIIARNEKLEQNFNEITSKIHQ